MFIIMSVVVVLCSMIISYMLHGNFNSSLLFGYNHLASQNTHKHHHHHHHHHHGHGHGHGHNEQYQDNDNEHDVIVTNIGKLPLLHGM